MTHRRYWIFLLMFVLATINYVDRIVLSVSSAPIAEEFGISKVELGYLFSSFLWLYVVCLVPIGMIVDKLGTGTTYLNFTGLEDEATNTGVASAFGRNLTRLHELKAKYDPENLFRLNNNIAPA